MELADSTTGNRVTVGWLHRPEGRLPLYVALHTPTASERSPVAVLCPPAGLEAATAYRAVRLLAERLARSGVTAVRFDYAGCGDSVDGGLQSSADDWLASICDVVSAVRRAGARRVALIGMRLGATLAAATVARLGVDELVLWDPCESGNAFLREERSLLRVAVSNTQPGRAPDGYIDGPGVRYTPDTVRVLQGLRLSDLIADAMSSPVVNACEPDATTIGRPLGVLVLYRPENANRRGINEIIGIKGVESIPASEQAAVFNQRNRLPEGDIEKLAQWLTSRNGMSHESASPNIQLDLYDKVAITPAYGRETVEERLIQIGQHRLLGVVTQTAARRGPVVVLANADATHRVGPARLWVDLSRRLAAAGATVVRFDGRGIGDSPWDGAPVPPALYTDESVQDIIDALETATSESTGDVILIGLCSAAWGCLMAATHARVRRIYAINNVVWATRPVPFRWEPGMIAGLGPGTTARRGHGTLRSRIRRMAATCVLTLTPEFLWWRLGARGHVSRCPSGLLTPVLRRGTRVTLLLGPREASRFHRLRGHRVMRRLRPGLRVPEVATLDHSLVDWRARTAVADLLAREITADAAQLPAAAVASLAAVKVSH